MRMPDKSLVFIHGFRSSTGAWTKLIQLLRDDQELDGVQIFTFGYATSVKPKSRLSTTRVPNNDDIAQMLESYLAAKVPAGEVAVVTHSQGGLILQRFLAWMLNEGRGHDLASIRLIVMLACPNLGSEYLDSVRTAAGLRHHPQARDLHPLNIDVTAAHRKVLNSIDQAEGVSANECKIPIYAYAGSEDNVVTPASAQDSFRHISVLAGGHSSILDPDAPDNFTFSMLKTLLREHFLAPAETENVPDDRSGESSAGATRARPAPQTAALPIEETLDLALTSEGIQVVHVTAGGPDGRTLLPVPPAGAMEEYHRALREAAALTVPPDDAATRRVRELVLPLRQALLRAVPDSLRQRLSETAGQAGRLVAIEVRLMNSELEAYPWELMADAADVVVWRYVSSAGPPERWTSNMLLIGAEGVREVRAELAGIRNELTGFQHLKVFDCAGNPPDLPQLLRRYRPAAFHLISYPAGNQGIQPQSVAADLRRSGVWAAVFNCPDSATAAGPGSRSPAAEIAARSGAVTIGMAGQLNPALGRLFAFTFYHWLAQGFSVLRAYHEAVRGIRNHGTYSAMWSIPVMCASSPNVIPFPVSPEARARLGLDQIHAHARALDRELQRLARGSYRSPGEWARHTAVPIVRTQCIVRYLKDATASRPPANEEERRHQERVDRARREFQDVLYATQASLRRLGQAVGPAERDQVLAELPLGWQKQRRTLGMLDDLVKQAR